jgi:hypothetical protein
LRVTSIGSPNEIAVARVFFSTISTSSPAGMRPRGVAPAARPAPCGRRARAFCSEALMALETSPEMPTRTASWV